MNARNMLDQLLGMGQNMLKDGAPGGSQTDGKGPGFGGGMLAGGALGLLLGNKRLRKMGGGVLAYGGAAALGGLAYKAYNDYQQQKAAGGAPIPTPATIDRLPAPAAELHAQAMLKALIAATKSDGHIDARERGLIEERLAPLADDGEMRRWIDAELERPLDPADVAATASSPELGAELYLISLLAVDEESFMERAYLDELARKLALPAELKANLETQVRRGL